MIALSLVSMLAFAGALDDDPAYQAGMKAFQDFEYPTAIDRFEAALESEGRSDEERAQLWVLMGLSHAELNDSGATSRAFERALVLDRTATLPLHASPKLVELFEAAKSALPPPQPPPPIATTSTTTTTAAVPASATADEPPGGDVGLLGVGAWVAGGLGVLAITTGAATFSWGWLIIDEANRQTFQSDAGRIEAQAVTAQVVGQVLAVSGVVVVVGAAGLATAAVFVE